MNNILIHVKNNEELNNYIFMIENNNFNEDLKYSKEVKEMIEEFHNNGWGVYLTTIENFDMNQEIWNDVYSMKEDQKLNITLDELNEKIGFMIIRNVGSVEGNFKMIAEYLDFIIEKYKGIALNNPIAMRKGMTKRYLVELDANSLKSIGMNTIPTKAFDKTVSYDELVKGYTNLENYLIKPITGELSNSLKCLNDIDEEFLRYKESKVGGWVVQPIKNEIWNGEYQLVFIGGELIYAQRKGYVKDENSNMPSQKNRIIDKYYPSENEVSIAKNVIKYFCELYNIKLDICRIDYMKDENGQPILIEFEMVNPGFFIGYMNEHDKTIKQIVRRIREYCENYKN